MIMMNLNVFKYIVKIEKMLNMVGIGLRCAVLAEPKKKHVDYYFFYVPPYVVYLYTYVVYPHKYEH